MSLIYIRSHYNVPAYLHQEIEFEGRKGVITGGDHNLKVNFYDEQNTSVSYLHPTYNIKYLRVKGNVRPLTRSQKRYQAFLNSETSLDFKDWLKGYGSDY